MRRGVWLLAMVTSMACHPATAGDVPTTDRPDSSIEAQIKARPSHLCLDDPRTSSQAGITNDDKRTLGEVLEITPDALLIQYRSPDWKGPEDVSRRAREILEARPRHLSSHLNWAEGQDFRYRGFVATVQMRDGVTARLEVASDYRVCVRDTRGRYWYFRNVPGDLWPGSGSGR